MYLLSENTEESFEFPNKSHVIVGRSDQCDISIDIESLGEKHFAIIKEKFGMVLEVFEEPLQVNNKPCKEMCLLMPGDYLCIGDSHLIVIDENKVPKESRSLKHTNAGGNENAMTSVYGIRSFTEPNNGEFIIPNQKLDLENFSLTNKKHLTLADNKSKVRVNGHDVSQTRIANGDLITSKKYKYVAEFPGSSGFSKFSPSHPRNVLLSEKVSNQTDRVEAKPTATFWQNNGWWITMLVGLIGIVAVLLLNI